MKLHRIHLALSLALCGTLAATVGCGGGGGSTSNPTPTPTPNGPTPTPSPTPTPGSGRYTPELLLPSVGKFGRCYGAGGNGAGGQVLLDASRQYHAFYWPNTGAPIDLNPPSLTRSYILGLSGNTQVGRAPYAYLWRGSVASGVSLHPATGYQDSVARAVDGEFQAGSATVPPVPPSIFSWSHAALWRGTAASFVDLNPTDFSSSEANGISGDTQVGHGYLAAKFGEYHALLWKGTAASAVDLNPSGFVSQANAVRSGIQVGFGGLINPNPKLLPVKHALLWRGTAESVVDIHPAGFRKSEAKATNGTLIVGSGVVEDGQTYDSQPHAIAWTGTTADTAIDLHKLVGRIELDPEIQGTWPTGSEATGIDDQGNIYGFVYDNFGNDFPFRWKLNK